jgi:activator of HSP90 ATPase
VYEALLDARQFSQFSGGASAEIDARPGGAFSCFGGAITGLNVELKEGQRIVQAWRAGNWPEGVYSIAHFEIAAHGAGSRLVFDQVGFPEAMHEHLAGGWQQMYWEPLKKHLPSVSA